MAVVKQGWAIHAITVAHQCLRVEGGRLPIAVHHATNTSPAPTDAPLAVGWGKGGGDDREGQNAFYGSEAVVLTEALNLIYGINVRPS